MYVCRELCAGKTGVNLKKFPSKFSCLKRNNSDYISNVASITLLNLYCTVRICMFLELLSCSLSRSTTDARSIHQKFYVNILICWNKSHSFMLRFFRKYRFGFHNKNLPRTVYYCTVYARIHLLLKKEKIACQIFFWFALHSFNLILSFSVISTLKRYCKT